MPLSHSLVLHHASLDRPQRRWSRRDWEVFRAVRCGPTPQNRELSREVVSRVRSGAAVADVAVAAKISRQYVYKLLAIAELRDRTIMARFYDRRRNLGRPIDLGGPRDVWISYDVLDEQDEVTP